MILGKIVPGEAGFICKRRLAGEFSRAKVAEAEVQNAVQDIQAVHTDDRQDSAVPATYIRSTSSIKRIQPLKEASYPSIESDDYT